MKKHSQVQGLATFAALSFLFGGAAVAQDETKSDKRNEKPKEMKSTKKVADGEAIFKQFCVSCHAAGGNIVKPAVPLAGSTKLVSPATFKAYLEAPPGHMPHYQNILSDKNMLDKLYKYCKTLKKERAPKRVAWRLNGMDVPDLD